MSYLELALGFNIFVLIFLLECLRQIKKKQSNAKTNLRDAIWDLNDHIHGHAKFMDSKGRADENYDSKEVAGLWDKYGEIYLKLRKITWDL